jgi:hypothetical protein
VRVAQETLRNVFGNGAHQLQPLVMRAQREGLDRRRDRLAHVEVRGIDVDLAGLDFREIEDVVDDGQQAVGRGFGHLDVLALNGLQLGAEDEIGHAENAVHGRADLVAHVRQELALRPARRFGGFFGLAQVLGLPAHLVAQDSDPRERTQEDHSHSAHRPQGMGHRPPGRRFDHRQICRPLQEQPERARRARAGGEIDLDRADADQFDHAPCGGFLANLIPADRKEVPGGVANDQPIRAARPVDDFRTHAHQLTVEVSGERLFCGDIDRRRTGRARHAPHDRIVNHGAVAAWARESRDLDFLARLDLGSRHFDFDRPACVSHKQRRRAAECDHAADHDPLGILRIDGELRQALDVSPPLGEGIRRPASVHANVLEGRHVVLHANELPLLIEERARHTVQAHGGVDELGERGALESRHHCREARPAGDELHHEQARVEATHAAHHTADGSPLTVFLPGQQLLERDRFGFGQSRSPEVANRRPDDLRRVVAGIAPPFDVHEIAGRQSVREFQRIDEDSTGAILHEQHPPPPVEVSDDTADAYGVMVARLLR